MRRVIIFFLMAVAVVLQLSLLPALRLFGVVPNVLLAITVLISLSVATSEALAAALVVGMIVDVVNGVSFGLWMGVLMLSTLVAGFVNRAGLELPGAIVAMALVSAGTVVMTLAIWSTLIAAGVGWPVPPSFGGRLVIELMLNLLLTIMLRPVVQWALSLGGRYEIGG